MELKGFQRSYLSKMAHSLQPVVTIGKAGFSDQIKSAVDEALLSHELIKVKFVDFKEDRKNIAISLADACEATLIRVIGNIAILYKEHPEKEKRRYKIP